jgi:L-ribulose-5-phosphate 3-epimerase UlaE
LPKYQGRYQAFPLGMWQEEFKIAKSFNLDLIEFILDYNDVEENPLIKKGGIQEIKTVINDTSVNVQTICADYFMEAPLHSKNEDIVKSSQRMMFSLLDSAKDLGVTDIIIPCVDKSSLIDQKTIDRFIKNLTPFIKLIEEYCINICIETDLKPQPFLDLLNRFQSNRITVNYDIGNSASLGYDLEAELAAYGDRITDIHIKDRIYNGGSVVLGKGNSDFKFFFKELSKYDYKGPLIIQAYLDNEGTKIFKDQLDWIKKYLYE